ncbi:MAG: ribonuclease R [Rhodobacteraceae bacterium]|nr:ribonuclease R [Paracoccaceae bacterium]
MADLPSRQDILNWIRDNPSRASGRDVARAFGIKGSARIDLKRLLRNLAEDGLIEKRKIHCRAAGELPPVTVLMIEAIDGGDLTARPIEWQGEGVMPRALVIPRAKDPALTTGDRILARLSKVRDDEFQYHARLIRRIGSGSTRVLGVYHASPEGGRMIPVDKRKGRDCIVPAGQTGGAKNGELVQAENIFCPTCVGLGKVRIVDRLGDPTAPGSVSLIAIHQHGIPDHFPDAAIIEAEKASAVEPGERIDLRHLPLFTIDPWDARDRDDAICAVPDEDPRNAGGHIVWVAIADVAHYVRPGSALDTEAKRRGNSTYFPDRVVPMLPDVLSGDLCSLHEGVDRACLAVRIRLNSIGEKLDHEFHRGLMRSPASMNYKQAQAAAEGTYDEMTAPLAGPIRNLFAAYESAVKARDARQPLNLDLPEREIVLSDDGRVTGIAFKERLEAHRLVEEFMIMANVCAAETLEQKRRHLLYRVHEQPSPEKIDALREVAEAAGLKFPKGRMLKTAQLNRLLAAVAGKENSETVSMAVLRSMTQAFYGPENLSHFGLNLKRYAHFTSPIRRYADLIVHRALITAHGWGDDGIRDDDTETLQATGDWISQTERRSMLAERDTTDRYLATFLSERVGEHFTGRVSGITRFALFVKFDGSGADGMVPLSHLGTEYWVYSQQNNSLTGDKSGRVIRAGDPVVVRLSDAAPLTGGLTAELLEIGGKPLPKMANGRRTHARKKRDKRKIMKSDRRR